MTTAYTEFLGCRSDERGRELTAAFTDSEGRAVPIDEVEATRVREPQRDTRRVAAASRPTQRIRDHDFRRVASFSDSLNAAVECRDDLSTTVPRTACCGLTPTKSTPLC
ncbi:hypothetical protein [Brevibacterium sandarakinum]|uniref:hypothetical protein n=1 Tax=Brevibacterium sandarakinum TaxID=629680 RepID=UPI00264FAC06|nr:hypothetical protein [Brevibacterium sandarakinum]MDN5656495.1 hypothetical protein [Brevibacterium sandarakinum]